MEFQDALKELEKAVQEKLGGTIKISILHMNNKEVVIE